MIIFVIDSMMKTVYPICNVLCFILKEERGMPTYTVFSKPGAFTEAQEEHIAEAITAAHAQATGAPRYYVQVILGVSNGCRRFVGGKPSEKQLWIRGDIRAGRTDGQLADLMLELMRRVAQAAEIEEEDVWIDLNEIKPTAILKYKTVFPPAGKEDTWFGNLPEALQNKLKALS
jgi:phenylpyruvate tautomerase PptA (4-oxalocrotonate tautomerase family)